MIDKQFADLPEEFRNEIPTATELLEVESTPQCPVGTKGRIAVFEMFEMSPEIEQAILHNPVESAVYKIARKAGLVTVKEDAIIKAMQKLVPFEEINQL
jgi:type II secretory ATPase GspE/PulE/Tfp pilus assembly ATPase PilB-like protein